jgi:hypothetical protein
MGLTRRRLLTGAGAAATLVVAGPPPVVRWVLAAPRQAVAVDAVLAAYVATLVPGPAEDPDGTPGAVEAEAVEQLHVQAPYVIPLVVTDVSAAAAATHGRRFEDLTYPEREELLVAAFADPTRSPYHLIALAVGAGTFYGDFRNRVGGTHLGFPGPSDGYLATFTDRTGHGQPQAEAIPA